MKNLILFLMALSTAAYAQTDDSGGLLAYRRDVVFEGKPHELYQNPRGDNVLIGKEEAKKHGVLLFGYARKALSQEGLYQIGFGAGFGTIGRERILADRKQAFVDSGLQAPWAPNDLRRDENAQYSNQQVVTGLAGTVNLSGAIRPFFYRHLRVSGTIDWPTVGDLANHQSNQGTRPDGSAYAFGLDHDILVIPSKHVFTAISAGYFAARHTMTYEFSTINPVQSLQSPHPDLPSVKVNDRNFSDSGVRVGIRIMGLNGVPAGFNLTVDLGRNGSRRVYTQMVVAFGGVKTPKNND